MATETTMKNETRALPTVGERDAQDHLAALMIDTVHDGGGAVAVHCAQDAHLSMTWFGRGDEPDVAAAESMLWDIMHAVVRKRAEAWVDEGDHEAFPAGLSRSGDTVQVHTFGVTDRRVYAGGTLPRWFKDTAVMLATLVTLDGGGAVTYGMVGALLQVVQGAARS